MNLNKYLLIGLMLIGCNDYGNYDRSPDDIDAGGSTSTVSEPDWRNAAGGWVDTDTYASSTTLPARYCSSCGNGGSTATGGSSASGGSSAAAGGTTASGGNSAASGTNSSAAGAANRCGVPDNTIGYNYNNPFCGHDFQYIQTTTSKPDWNKCTQYNLFCYYQDEVTNRIYFRCNEDCKWQYMENPRQ